MGNDTKPLFGLIALAVLVGATLLFLERRDRTTSSVDPLAGTNEVAHAAEAVSLRDVPEFAELARQPAPLEGSRENLRAMRETSGSTRAEVAVRRAEDGAPVPGARVRLHLEDVEVLGDGPPERTTDEAGVVRFPLEHGTSVLGLWIGAGETTASLFDWTRRTVVSGNSERFEVEVGPGATLSGTVVDGARRPVGAALVRGWCTRARYLDLDPRPAPDRVVVADARGRFQIAHMGEFFALDASAPGMACLHPLHGEVEAGASLEQLELVLAPAGRIDGVVLDPSGAPLGEVEITSPEGWTDGRGAETGIDGVLRADPFAVRATTTDSGNFSISGIPPWEFALQIDHSGHAPWRGKHSPGDGFLEIRLEQGLVLVGRVFAANGRPLAGAGVRLGYKVSARTKTDERGFFRLIGLAEDPGAFLFVQAEGHAMLVLQPIVLRPDLREEIEVTLEREWPLAGRLVDAAGTAVSNAVVAIEGDRVLDFGAWVSMSPTPTWERRHRLHETRTDENGDFRFERLYQGAFRIEATHPDDPHLRVIDQAESGREDLELVLDPEAIQGVAVVGRVSDAVSGEPIRSFTIQPILVRDSDWKAGERHSLQSERGEYALDGLQPGAIRFWVEAHGYAKADLPEQDYGAGKHRLDFELWPERSLHLRVVDPEGEPFDGAILWIRDRDGNHVSFRSGGQSYAVPQGSLDARGEAQLQKLPALPLTLVVGGLLTEESAEFEVDLTVQPETVQQFVLRAERPAYLYLSVFTVPADSELESHVWLETSKTPTELADELDDVFPLDAASFQIEVLDPAERVRGTASGSRDMAGRWNLRWTRGNAHSGGGSAGPPTVQFALPRTDLEIFVEAAGHTVSQVHLEVEQLPDSIGSSNGLAILLRRDD